jgi:hypothetical protein
VRRDITFPREALDEVRRMARGFTAPEHLEDHLDDFREWTNRNPQAGFQERETQRQKIIFQTNMDGKEILQWYERTTIENSTVDRSIEEVVQHLLSNPDYLSDKDPYKSINNMVVNLGHKHEFISPLQESDLEGVPDSLGREFIEIYNHEISSGYFQDTASQHLSHIKILIRLSELVIETADLDHDESRLLTVGALLHDLCLLQDDFASLLMNPNGRLSRPVFQRVLDSHPWLTVNEFEDRLDTGRLSLPYAMDTQRLKHLLRDHHRYWLNNHDLLYEADRDLHELLHVIDNLAVFADYTRPDYWSKGFLPLSELGPRWVDSQYDNDLIGDRTRNVFQQLFDDRTNAINQVGQESRQFLVLHNALQLASLLNEGINPQNPHMIRELEKRHGQELIDRLWSKILETNLPVDEKVKIIRRLDDLAPLFKSGIGESYEFINASPKPVQKTVDQIENALEHDRQVILIGLFPRVTRAFERFMETGEYQDSGQLEDVLAVAGERRLQFIRHSYPYEAEFEQPFHQIIRQYRQQVEPDTSLCFIPFVNFYRGFSPVRDPASRIRKLEKASSVEDHTPPERVRYEADRFQTRSADEAHLDTLENERFKQIFLNDFSNREILYFYQHTLDPEHGLQDALRETIGALWENPNYLSERNSRYSLHELVRSLSQIHFFDGDQSSAKNVIEDYLARSDISDHSAYEDILEELGSELNFFKNTLSQSIYHLEVLKNGSTPCPAEIYCLLSAGLICNDSAWRDFLLSPEDISYNSILRKRLLLNTPDIRTEALDADRLQALPESVRSTVKQLLSEPYGRDYGRIQTALYLGMAVDFSRVENWERGHRRIHERDLEHFLYPLEESLSQYLDPQQVDDCLSSAIDQSDELLKSLNRHARSTYSYVYLFNALTFASELRYGFFPGGVNSLDNVRELYGTERVNSLINGIIHSDLSALESIKVSRKIRYLSSAISRSSLDLETAYVLNLDRSGTWSVPGDVASDDSIFLLSGELSTAGPFWSRIKQRIPRLAERAYCIVGEEYPLLIKETSLSRTDELKRVVTDYRENSSKQGQYLLMPAHRIFESIEFGQNKGTETNHLQAPQALFMKTWLRLFESEFKYRGGLGTD